MITQFEWAWQNPRKSRRLRHVANKTSKEKSIDFCFRVLSAMLNVGPWNRLPLTIRWLKQEYKMEFDVDQLPPMHMPIVYGPLNKRKPKKGNNGGSVEVEEANNTCYRCVECSKKIKVYNAHFQLNVVNGNRKYFFQICPEMQVIEIHALYDKHHKVSSFLKSHQNIHNSVKYELKYESNTCS